MVLLTVYIVFQSDEVQTNLFPILCSLKLKNFVPHEHGNYYIFLNFVATTRLS